MVKVMQSIVRGPLAPYVAGLAAELLERGYTRSSAEQHICFVAHLDRWLLAEGLGVGDLSESTIRRYLTDTPRGWLRVVSVVQGDGAASGVPGTAAGAAG
jgi:hypothetical protein